jgi:hypothetical protein
VDDLRERAKDHHAARRLRHALMVKLDDGSGTVSEDLLDLWLEVEWETMKATTWHLWEVHEPPLLLDRETGELHQGVMFEPIRKLERSQIPVDLLAPLQPLA